jgi:hypothetical protein
MCRAETYVRNFLDYSLANPNLRAKVSLTCLSFETELS